MKFTIKDDRHAKGGTIIEAKSPLYALKKYVRAECDDAGNGDRINVEILDEVGEIWRGTAEIEEVREIHASVVRDSDLTSAR